MFKKIKASGELYDCNVLAVNTNVQRKYCDSLSKNFKLDSIENEEVVNDPNKKIEMVQNMIKKSAKETIGLLKKTHNK